VSDSEPQPYPIVEQARHTTWEALKIKGVGDK